MIYLLDYYKRPDSREKICLIEAPVPVEEMQNTVFFFCSVCKQKYGISLSPAVMTELLMKVYDIKILSLKDEPILSALNDILMWLDKGEEGNLFYKNGREIYYLDLYVYCLFPEISADASRVIRTVYLDTKKHKSKVV